MNQIEKDGVIYFNNLPGLVAGGFKSAHGLGAGWTSFPYELDCFSGIGLVTGAMSGAGELVFELNLRGVYRLSFAHNPALRIWLDGDHGYCELSGDTSSIQEYAFPAMEMNERRLHIAPTEGADGFQNPVTFFYFKAEPCTLHQSRKNLIATNDGHHPHWNGAKTERDLYRIVYPLADSDFSKLIYGTYGGTGYTLKPGTSAGESPIWAPDTSYRKIDIIYNNALKTLAASHTDPLAVMRKVTWDFGMEYHIYYRTACFYSPFPYGGRTMQFFKNHPEARCVDEFGERLNFISYAFPQVQKFALDYFEHLLDYKPDGLTIAFNRGLPMMICEEPVLEAYYRRYGRYPRLPEEVDTPELLQVKQEMMAVFVEKVRQLTDRRGAKLSCIVPRYFERNRLFGLDIELLLERRLFDFIMVGAGHGDTIAMTKDLQPVRALQKYGVPIYPGGAVPASIGGAWNDRDWKNRARYMLEILDSQFAGGFFWDVHNIARDEMDRLRRFGDYDYLEKLANGKIPLRVSRETRRIHETHVTRYPTFAGF